MNTNISFPLQCRLCMCVCVRKKEAGRQIPLLKLSVAFFVCLSLSFPSPLSPTPLGSDFNGHTIKVEFAEKNAPSFGRGGFRGRGRGGDFRGRGDFRGGRGGDFGGRGKLGMQESLLTASPFVEVVG